MPLWKSMMLWLTLVGVAVGCVGIPVPVPATSWWTWMHPLGFRTASVLSLGTLGFLIGSFVDLIRWRRQARLPEALLWFTGLAILALFIAVVQVYRLAASDAEENWSNVSASLGTFYVVSQELSKNPPNTELQNLSAELRESGARLFVVSRYYDRDRKQNISMENVSSALTTAGNLLISQNPQDVEEAKQFVQRAGNEFMTMEKQANGSYSQQTTESILNAISALVPSAFTQNYGGF